MPDTETHSSRDFSQYDAMSTKELEAILRQDSENEAGESDPEQLLYIMEVLSNRTEIPKSPEEALCSFREHYKPMNAPKKHSRCFHHFAAIAAVLVLVLLTALPATSSPIGLWQQLADWSREIFHFGTEYQMATEDPNEVFCDSLTSLVDAMRKMSIPTDIVPTWIPDGYDNVKLNILESPHSNTISAMYQNHTGKTITIQVKNYVEAYVQLIEKSDDVFEIYTNDGNTFYIFDNNQLYHAVWQSSIYELYIAGNIEIEQLHLILNSIN